jgi:hypothetical protein
MHKANLREGKEAELIYSLRLKRAFVGIRLYEGRKDVLTLRQVHSAVVHFVEEHVEGLEGDALITQTRGLKIGVRTADCVPVVLVGERTLAVVHAGWRGLKEGIIENTIKTLKELEDIKSFLAFVGPSAKACCYQVGEEFKKHFTMLHYRNSHLYMDTQREALLRLRKGGLERLVLYGVCTVCSQRLPSYRRDRTERRLLTFGKLL